MSNQTLLWWYERVADWLIANPDKTLKECAIAFNCHTNTVYNIRNSDSFKLYFEARSKQVSQEVDTNFSTAMCTMPEKLAAVAEQALDLASEKMHRHGGEMAITSVVAIADMALKKLGYGTETKVSPGGNVQVNLNVVTGPMLEKARARLIEARGHDKPLVLTPPRESTPMSEDAA
jgi:hypothetical protein